jgi:hypothetical protein
MTTGNMSINAAEKEKNRFQSETKFIEQKYTSQRNLLEKQKSTDLERARMRHTATIKIIKNNA